MMSQVDVFVPCYNYGRYLRGCVESILEQEGVQVRVVILDDCSSDDSSEVGQALAEADQRVEYRRHSVNLGHIATYNEGIDWAEGDYTLLLSADDQLTPGALARAAGLMDRHPEVGFTYGRVIKTEDPQQETTIIDNYYESKTIKGNEFIELCCQGNSYGENIVPTPTAVVRTTLQKQLGGYRKELPHAGDFEMWLRFAAHAEVGKVEVEQAYYRFHHDNMFRNYIGVKDIQQRIEAWDTLFREYGDRLEQRDWLRRLSRRRTAEAVFWQASDAFAQGDSANCQTLLDFALSIDPTLKDWSSWHRLRIKRALGLTVWKAVDPLVRRLTGRSEPDSSESLGKSEGVER
jgi:glycosyltransferase involved in cell wall biosynthesis